MLTEIASHLNEIAKIAKTGYRRTQSTGYRQILDQVQQIRTLLLDSVEQKQQPAGSKKHKSFYNQDFISK